MTLQILQKAKYLQIAFSTKLISSELRIIEEYEKFSIMLKEHIWESIELHLNNEDDFGCPDTSIT